MVASTPFFKVVLMTALLSVIVQLTSCIRLDSWHKSSSLESQGPNEEESVSVLKEALQEAAERQLEDLQALETYLNHQIAELQRKKIDVQRKKRGHFACRVHAIACYKKRSSQA